MRGAHAWEVSNYSMVTSNWLHNVFEMEVREAREAAEARSREVSQLQSNLAWHKSRVDEQNAQLRVL
jgi:hypothetical protein